jgi:hypothetical protein
MQSNTVIGKENVSLPTVLKTVDDTLVELTKGSFGSHHLGLESNNSFMILIITCLATTELVMEFI